MRIQTYPKALLPYVITTVVTAMYCVEGWSKFYTLGHSVYVQWL